MTDIGAVLADSELPVSVRYVFYRLVAAGYPKKQAFADRVQWLLAGMRKGYLTFQNRADPKPGGGFRKTLRKAVPAEFRVPLDAIVDHSRSTIGSTTRAVETASAAFDDAVRPVAGVGAGGVGVGDVRLAPAYLGRVQV